MNLLATWLDAEALGVEPGSGRAATAGGELRWGAEGIALGAQRLEAGALGSLQVSRSSELVAPTGLARMLERAPRRVDVVHLELRARDARLRLSAVVAPHEAAGLPELRIAGSARVEAARLRAVALHAIALGARMSRFEAAAIAGEQSTGERVELELCDDRAPIERDGLWGYVNGDGHLVIPCRYDEARPFSEGFAPVRAGSVWGYIDRYGARLGRTRLDAAGPFYAGQALVETEDGRVGSLFANGIFAATGDVRQELRYRAALLLVFALGMLAFGVHTLTDDERQTQDRIGHVFAAACTSIPSAVTSWALWRRARGLTDGRPRERREVLVVPDALDVAPGHPD